ncbi:hypothetical protein [Rufibacter tibetensis]|uniref:DUF3298 domain-containing protein n=1 Tax=Rufibacter tibetensis TaxID=512763 RepID=A0A0P0C0G8_9BACT|nr:hypothetical protein [Rufibacter tibetensis]ALI98309.1 hypothetical protein DC20_04065 [Rufibacter tibetensis]
MKNYHKVVLAITSLFLFTYCGDSKPAPAESITILKGNVPTVLAETTASENLIVENQNEGEPKPSSYTATCLEEEEKNPESEDPIIIRTCTYRNYKTITTGTPDFKGRYSYRNSLFKLEKGEYKVIDNSSLFNQRQDDLLKRINEKIKANYLVYLKDPESNECFEGVEPIRDFKINELRIDFEANQLVFHAEFELSGACFNVGGTSIPFKLQEIDPYINK